MSEERIELRRIKTVMRQSQDETWSYETRAETRHERVETESFQKVLSDASEVRWDLMTFHYTFTAETDAERIM